MEFNLIDFVKDFCFTITLVSLVGGGSLIGGATVLGSFPAKFTSVIIFVFLTSLVIPLILSTIDLIIYNPGMVFAIELEEVQKMSKCRKILLIAGNFLLCL